MRGHGPFVRLTLLAVAAALALAAAEGPAPAATGDATTVAPTLVLDPGIPAGGTGTSDGVTTPPAPADLVVSVTRSPEPAQAAVGGVTDHVVVTNRGLGTATGVTVTDVVSDPLRVVGPAPATFALAPGDPPFTFDFTVVSDRSGIFDRTVRATTTAPDANPADNAAGVVSTFTCALCVTTTTAPTSAVAFQPLTYTVTVRNPLDVGLTGVGLSDTLPEAAAFAPDPLPTGCRLVGRIATCLLGDLAPGASRSVSLRGTPQVAGPQTNVADATATIPDIELSRTISDTSRATVVVEPPPRPPDLELTQTDDPDPVPARALLTYIFTLRTNLSSRREVELVDTLPAGVDFVSSSLAGCAVSGRDLTCSFGTLAPGASATATVAVRPTAPGVIANTAFARAPTTVDECTCSGSIESWPTVERTQVVSAADLSIEKSAPAAVDVGDSFDYTLVVRNDGPQNVRTVVTDPLPGGVQLVSATATAGACGSSAGTVTCSLGVLAEGAKETITIRVRAVAPGDVVNAASVGPEPDPDGAPVDSNPGNNRDDARTTVRRRPDPAADLAIAASASPGTVNVGDTITLSFPVRNLGPATASGVVVTDALPGSVALVSASSSQGSCSGAATVTCALGSLAPGGTSTVTIRARALATGTIASSASVTSSTLDPDRSNNVASTTATASSADVSVVVAASPDPVSVGRALTYDVTVGNAGPSDALDVVITDQLPAGAQLVSATASRGSCTPVLAVCRLGGLGPGEQAHVTLVVVPGAASALTNTVTALSTVHDPAPENNTALSVTRALAADVSVQLRAEPAPATVSEPLTYTIDVRNAGPTEARDVRLRDPLPAGVALVAASPSRGSCAGAATIECSLGTLAPGETATVTVVVVPRRPGSLTNSVTAAGADFDPDETSNSASVSTTVTSADVAVTITPAADPVGPGARLTYTVRVQNNGPTAAHGVQLAADLPADATAATAHAAAGTCRTSLRVVCELGDLGVGASTTVRISLRPRQPGTLTLAARVSGDDFDPVLENNHASASATARWQPQLLLVPAVGPPGSVPSVVGAGFPPGALVVLHWQPGTGGAVVRADADGKLRARILVFPHDGAGSRALDATPATGARGEFAASAPFLVVPGRLEPRDFVERG